MKKMIAAAMAMILGLVSVTGYSQTKPDVKGFDQSVFDYHFSRADRELSPDQWMSQARRGAGLAINAWELFASDLYDNPLVFEQAKKQLEDWSEQELEERFFQWLSNRFFASAAEDSAENMANALKGTQLRHTYHLDENGNIAFDASTGDPLLIRPSDTAREQNRNFSDDLLEWRSDTQRDSAAETAAFEASLARMYPELLAYIPEAQRESMGAKLFAAGKTAVNALRQEFEKTIAREERAFVSRRTGDILSLRKKSDDEAAWYITSQLIAEAEAETNRGIVDLNHRIEEAQAGTGDIALHGEEWLAMFQEQFERGLKAWEEAEERFFIRRIQWEQDSGKLFSDGNDVWLAAYDKLNEEFKNWELNVKVLFDSGKTLFTDASENLEKAITAAGIELEYNIQMRTEAGTARAAALVDMYLICASTSTQALETVEFWLMQYGEKDLSAIGEDNFDEWLAQERKKIWRQAVDIYTAQRVYTLDKSVIDSNLLFSLAENYEKQLAAFNSRHSVLFKMEDFANGEGDFSEELELAQELSQKYENLVSRLNYLYEAKKSFDLYNSYVVKTLEYRTQIMSEYSELFGSGLLKDILAEDASSEDFVLDEYQIALVKAKTVLVYWERQTAIAQAVVDYAGDIGAGRMTEAESIQAWKSAKAEYEQAVSQYDLELQKLTAFGADVKKKSDALNELAKTMNDAQAALNQIGKDYSMAFNTSSGKGSDYALNYLKSRYLTLLDKYNQLYNPESDAIYLNAIDTLVQIVVAQNFEWASYYCNLLLNGDNENISLAAIALFADAPYNKIRSDKNYSSIDWYAFVKGITHDQAETALAGTTLQEKMYNDFENSYTALLEKRLALELDALKWFLDTGNGETSEGEYLSQFCILGRDTAQKMFEELVLLDERLRTGKNLIPDAAYFADDEIKTIILQFLNGESFFGGTDVFLVEEYTSYQLCLDLLNVYSQFGSISSFAAKESLEYTSQALNELFEVYSLEADAFVDGVFLPGIQNISKAILEMDGDFTVNAAQFLFDLSRALDMLPPLIKGELAEWKEALVQYISFSAMLDGREPAMELSAFDEKFENINNRDDALAEYVASIIFFDNKTLKEINSIEREIANEKELASYQQLITYFLETYKESEIAADTQNIRHWREYITGAYIDNIDDDESLITGAYAWISGTEYDLDMQAQFWDRYVNDVFSLYSAGYNAAANVDVETLIEKYNDEYDSWQKHLDDVYELMDEISYYGRMYDFSKLTSTETETELVKLDELRKTQLAKLDTANTAYASKALEFELAGAAYDSQYAASKAAFNEMEEKRFLLEVQDAIRRWAGTAYLASEMDELADCEKSLERAQVVLDVLENLYDEEKQRAYNNPAYDDLYSQYEQSYARLLRALKAGAALNSEIAAEQQINDQAFADYYQQLHTFGLGLEYEKDYVSPEDRKEWTLKDVITIKENGALGFSKDSNNLLVGLDESGAETLQDYFTLKAATGNETYGQSQFEIAIRELSQRMEGYLTSAKKYNQWALARDYLIETLLDKNSKMKFLSNSLKEADAMREGQQLGNREYMTTSSDGHFVYELVSAYQRILNLDQKRAWDGLSAEERADLEFYVILTLSGSKNDYFYGFSQYQTFLEYNFVYTTIEDYYEKAKDLYDQWYNPRGWFYKEARDKDKDVLDKLNPGLKAAKKSYKKWKDEVKTNILNIKETFAAYTESCERIAVLMGNADDDQNIDWEKIKDTLKKTNSLTDDEITALELDWDTMQTAMQKNNKTIKYTSVFDAIGKMIQWARDARNTGKIALEDHWQADNTKRQGKEAEFDKTVENFINGTGSITDLETAARSAFGNESTAWKNHLEGLGNILSNDLSLLVDFDAFYLSERASLGNEITALFSRTLQYKYDAEESVRKTEWEMQRQDIAKKYSDWQKTVDSIVEKGRQDWLDGIQRMEDAYRIWINNFKSEFEEISHAWDEAYLAGLQDKEDWLAQVAAAANQASSEAFLSIVGADAERLSRVMDTRDPLGILGADVLEAGNILAGLLDMPGIGNLNSIFDSIGTMSTLSDAKVRRGMGNGIWDTGSIKAVASELARTSNAELAAQESRKLAHNVRMNVDASIDALQANIDWANKSFRKNMDDLFIFQGQWNKNGSSYTKKIIVNSTLFDPVITEEKRIERYRDYSYGPIELETNISDSILEGIDYYAMIGLIESVQGEISSIAANIFGDTNDPVPIKSKKPKEKRTQSPGKFGAYIGYEPLMKNLEKVEKKIEGRDDVFSDKGKGEQGRLMYDFMWYAVMEGQGVAQLALAPWDKPMWDDRDSFFEAPTLRSTVDFVIQAGVTIAGTVMAPVTGGASAIGAMALSAAINTADDLVFAGLDIAGGYKSWGEAGFDFGKAALINTVSSFGSGVFNGAVGVKEGFFTSGNGFTGILTDKVGNAWGKLTIRTGMAGVQALTVGTATNALSAATYSSNGAGLQFNNDVFNAGMMQTGISALSGMTSTLVSGTLGNWTLFDGNNIGLNKDIVDVQSMQSFHGLVGGLAGQAVEYGFTGDFKLNLANLSMLGITGVDSNGNKITASMGLLELTVGRNGTGMKIGSGGADVSYTKIADSMSGMMNTFKVGGAKLSALFGANENLSTINAANMMSYTGINKDVELSKNIWDKKMKVNYADLDSKELGSYNENNPNEMTLNKSLLGGGKEESAKLAAVMAHEGEHALGTNVEALAHERALTTYVNIASAFQLQVDQSFAGEMFLGVINPENRIANTGDTQYWKITREGNLIFDGSKNLYDQDGNLIKEYTGTGGYTDSLADIMGVPYEVAHQMLVNAGLTWEDGTFKTSQGVDAKNNYDIQIKPLDHIEVQLSPPPSPAIPDPTSPEVNPTSKNGFDTAVDSIKSAGKAVKDFFSGLWNKNTQPEPSLQKDHFDANDYYQIPGGSADFADKIMTPADKEKYKAIEKRDENGKLIKDENGYVKLDTFCNGYLQDQIKEHLGEDLNNLIFRGNGGNTNTLFADFNDNPNPNLERLDPAVYTQNGKFDDIGFLTNIQEMANNGVLIILLAKASSNGHIAFVGNSGLTLSTVQPPSYTKADYESKPMTGNELRDKYSNEGHVVVVQAGTYTGITSVRYATNDWRTSSTRQDLLKNSLYFYAVKGGIK